MSQLNDGENEAMKYHQPAEWGNIKTKFVMTEIKKMICVRISTK